MLSAERAVLALRAAGVRAEAVSQWPQARAGDQPHARYTVTATSTSTLI